MDKKWEIRSEYIYQCINGFEDDSRIRNEAGCGGKLEEAINRAYEARRFVFSGTLC